ncbi:MAG: hypothetical protein L6Q29_05385, partial [Candidatus Pacebacteria bacterium]|nr:hypothetical protein [Candidatus Paceibacterota bacterium]
FPITYLIPISIAAWYNNSRLALVLSILMPLGRLSFNIFFWSVPWTYAEAIVNCSIRIVVFCSFTYLLSKVSLQTQELRSEVEVLSGLLPICANCKKIRDNSNKWQPLESYISQRSEAEFTHGICPDCVEKLYGNVLNKK